ncbi:DEAD/DEAH box helicase [Corynebacterium poyangense]|uniref:DEAD/DEAH box helicase n=1 Tax=Corynebacterium poyangense TaxID=2684405 RepID=A0A7H0SNR9_9CORY|nr:DEAD/DEAH box helicase [Corynebacterium poyangense]QNQ90194.1 DEAD/DEAH box helicase [Corynebacterium poyangense]
MSSFKDLGLTLALCQSLSKAGLREPFPIQTQTIPDILSGCDVLAKGPTGSGKTFAFGLPILSLLAGAPSLPGHPRALILAPTRELSQQILDSLSPHAAAVGLRMVAVIGGVPLAKDRRLLAAPVDVLIATPGRAIDLVNHGLIHLDQVAITVLDEADEMSDQGFLPQVRTLLEGTPQQSQRLLFSATLDEDITEIVRRFLHDPQEHTCTENASQNDQKRYVVFRVNNARERQHILARIATRQGQSVCFVRTRHSVERQRAALQRYGISVSALSGAQTQRQRQDALDGFRTKRSNMLIATDIAARGIDIPQMDLIVHLEPPQDLKSFIHRSGRTARAGSYGTVVMMCLPKQVSVLHQVLGQAQVKASWYEVHPRSPELERILGAMEFPSFTREPQRTPNRSTRTRRLNRNRRYFRKDAHKAR